MYIYIYIYIHMYIHIYIYTYLNTRTYMHSHTPKFFSSVYIHKCIYEGGYRCTCQAASDSSARACKARVSAEDNHYYKRFGHCSFVCMYSDTSLQHSHARSTHSHEHASTTHKHTHTPHVCTLFSFVQSTHKLPTNRCMYIYIYLKYIHIYICIYIYIYTYKI